MSDIRMDRSSPTTGEGGTSGTMALLVLVVAYGVLPLFLPEPSTITAAGMWKSDLGKWVVTTVMVLVVVAWEGRSPGSIGLRRPRLKEAGIGLAVGAGWLVLFWMVKTVLLEPAGLSVVGATQRAFLSLAPLQRISIVLTAAVTEEIIFRGILMQRVEELTGSSWLAVAATVLLFVGGHGAHFGLVVNAFQAVVTVVFALLYLWRRDLTSLVTLHAVIDGWALLVVPALGL